jgi:hypothetical protein
MFSNINKVSAQLEIGALGGYTFKESYYVAGGKGFIDDGFTYGLSLSYKLDNHIQPEILVLYQPTIFSVNSSLLDDNFRSNGQMIYYMIGGNKLFPVNNDDLNISTGLKIGGVTACSDNREFNSKTFFSAGVNAGVEYFFSDVVGIKACTNLLLPIIDPTLGFFWSTGSGASVGVSSTTPIVQFNMMGGIVLRFQN